jgi:hypothetical protein
MKWIINPIKTSIEELGFIERSAGIVQPVSKTFKDPESGSERRFTFPVADDLTGVHCLESGLYFEMLPNDKYTTTSYFEEVGPLTFNGYADEYPKRKFVDFTGRFRFVCWLNLKKLGISEARAPETVFITILRKFLENDGRFTYTDDDLTGDAYIEYVPQSRPIRGSSVFSRYTLPERLVNVLYPFDYFAIDFTARLVFSKDCLDDFTAGVELTCINT